MTNATIKDVARLCGYSIKTVSRVVNKYPTVDRDIYAKVEAAIAKLGYQPNVWARSLRSSRSHVVALFANDPTVTYVNRIQLAATSVCRQLGYHLMMEMSPPVGRNTAKSIRDISESVHLEGALLVPPDSDCLPFLKALVAEKLPFVRVSPYKYLDLSSYVQIDDYKIAYDMTRYLIELGHRDIAFVMGPTGHGAAIERLRGFNGAMSDHGLIVFAQWLVPGNFDIQSGMEAGQVLLSEPRWPTAVLASNDESAIGVMAAAYSKGVAIPRDLSIVGIDDAPIASQFWPKLTTIRQPVADLGRVATEILINEIESVSERRVEKLECEIVVRESAGPPPRSAKRTRAR